MTATRVQRVTSFQTDVASVSGTLAAPTPGNLLVVGHYASTGDQSSIAGPAGFSTAIKHDNAVNGCAAIYYKIADGTETGTLVLTNVNNAGCWVGGIFEEWDADGVFETPLDQTGQGGSGSAATITLACSGANTEARELVFALYGVSGASGGFLNTWTNGFAQDTALGNRMELGVKETSAIETSSTVETWTTARTPRGVIASFKLPVPVPQNFAGTAPSATEAQLTWDAVADATRYELRRDGLIVADDIVTTSYLDTGLTPLTPYDYDIRTVIE